MIYDLEIEIPITYIHPDRTFGVMIFTDTSRDAYAETYAHLRGLVTHSLADIGVDCSLHWAVLAALKQHFPLAYRNAVRSFAGMRRSRRE